MSIKIGIISDIHGNMVALEEVLKDIKDKGIDQVYCLGDLVDFAPWGNEVIDRIRSLGIPCVLGNHDERIAFNLPVVPLTHQSAYECSMRISAIEYSKKTISSNNKKWMGDLPLNIEISFKIGEKIQEY